MKRDILSALRPAAAFGLLSALLLGLVYPFVVLGIGQALLPRQANGSLIVERGRVVGSALIGQSFTRPGYFHGRPSAAGAGYDGLASSGSNLGPASEVLFRRVRDDVAALRREHPGAAVPADLATASASGLDPDISPAAADWQVARVARERGLPVARVRTIVASETSGPVLGLLGEPRVNVLALNRRLDAERSD